MTSILALLSTGHRLLHALLMEARAATGQGDWADAQRCLAEFAQRLETHMRAEETVLFPRLSGLGAEVDAMLARCRREHEGLRIDMRTTMAACKAHDRIGFGALLAHLREAFSRHCRDEEQRLYTLTGGMDEDDLGALARALSAAGDDEGASGPVPPPSSRLH